MALAQSTRQQYSRLARRLQEAYASETGASWSDDPLAFATWFGEKVQASGWARRTFWLYRAAVVWFMEHNGPAEATEALRRCTARLSKTGVETSARKLKKLPVDLWRQLTEALRHSKNPLDLVLFHWLEAGRVSGLRPCEWEHAAMRSATLVVRNAKYSEIRANGAQRTLIFDPAYNRGEIAAIQAFLRDVRAWTGSGRSFRELYDCCRKRLSYVRQVSKTGMDKESGQGISLYSPRHQFAADMKASGLSKARIAALMGHASEDSATIHYARRKDGQKRVPPASPENEVASVRRGAVRPGNETGDPQK